MLESDQSLSAYTDGGAELAGRGDGAATWPESCPPPSIPQDGYLCPGEKHRREKLRYANWCRHESEPKTRKQSKSENNKMESTKSVREQNLGGGGRHPENLQKCFFCPIDEMKDKQSCLEPGVQHADLEPWASESRTE